MASPHAGVHVKSGSSYRSDESGRTRPQRSHRPRGRFHQIAAASSRRHALRHGGRRRDTGAALTRYPSGRSSMAER